MELIGADFLHPDREPARSFPQAPMAGVDPLHNACQFGFLAARRYKLADGAAATTRDYGQGPFSAS